MIAIHKSNTGFHPRWVKYCEENNIPFKLVNCYDNDLVDQLKDCDALMWHHSQANPKDIVIAKQILFALEHAGFKVFPDFKTGWHFDEKAGQKYLLEAVDAPLVPSYLFFDKDEAISWAKSATYPKVWKLSGGAGSANVKLVRSFREARNLINRAFGKGYKQYDKLQNLKDRWGQYRKGRKALLNVAKGVLRLGYEPEFSRVKGTIRGYIYFQDFIPGNDHDIRIIIIGDKAFAIKRLIRENDFRASGSGRILYEKHHFNDNLVKLSFQINERIQSQSLALDYIYDNGKPYLVEISYGFVKEVYDPCVGYWDKELNWHEGKFDPYGWMVELVRGK